MIIIAKGSHNTPKIVTTLEKWVRCRYLFFGENVFHSKYQCREGKERLFGTITLQKHIFIAGWIVAQYCHIKDRQYNNSISLLGYEFRYRL